MQDVLRPGRRVATVAVVFDYSLPGRPSVVRSLPGQCGRYVGPDASVDGSVECSREAPEDCTRHDGD